jgi:hypothetical protein
MCFCEGTVKYWLQVSAYFLSMSLFATGILASVHGGPWWGYLLTVPIGLLAAMFAFLGADTFVQRLLLGVVGVLLLAAGMVHLVSTGFSSSWFTEAGFALFSGSAVLLPAFVGNSSLAIKPTHRT